MNWIKSFSLVDWLWIYFLNCKISLFWSIKPSCNNRLCLQEYVEPNFSSIYFHLFHLCICSRFVVSVFLNILRNNCVEVFFFINSLQLRSFIKGQTSGTTSDNKWQRVTASCTTSDNEWQRVVQWVTTSGTKRDNEWQRVVQRMTASDNEWYNDWQQRYRDVFKPILIIGFCFTIF